MRFVEFAIFLVPLLALVLWRVAVARGLDGPPPRQLLAIFAALLLLAALLSFLASRERLPPGQYVPAQMQGGRIIPGHAQ